MPQARAVESSSVSTGDRNRDAQDSEEGFVERASQRFLLHCVPRTRPAHRLNVGRSYGVHQLFDQAPRPAV